MVDAGINGRSSPDGEEKLSRKLVIGIGGSSKAEFPTLFDEDIDVEAACECEPD